MNSSLSPAAPTAKGVPSFLVDLASKQQRPTQILDDMQGDKEEAEKERADAEYAKLVGASAGKPLGPQSVGQAVSEVGNIAANAVVGAVTDYADLAAGVGDVGRALVGNAPWDQVFNDADNPWVRWRRNSFRTETQVGRVANTVVRIGVALASGGIASKALKYGSKGVQASTGLKLFDKAEELGKMYDAMWGIKQGTLDDLGKAIGKTSSRGARESAKRLDNVDQMLRMPMAELGSRVAQGSYDVKGFIPEYLGGLKRSIGMYANPNISTKLKVKTLADFLAWDAFVDFMVAGEGDVDFEETLGDVFQTFGSPFMHSVGSLTMTRAEDTALQIKAKNMLEGIGIGAMLKPLMDSVAIFRYARSFKNANEREQLEIISRVNGNQFQDFARLKLDDITARATSDPAAARGNIPPSRALSIPYDAVQAARQAGEARNAYNWTRTQLPGTGQELGASPANVREVVGGPLSRPTGEVEVRDLGVPQPPGPGQIEGTEPAGLLEPQPPGQLPGAGPDQPLLEPGGLIGQPGAERALLEPGGPGTLAPGQAPGALNPELDYPIQPVRVIPLREPEPIVTPQTFRSGLEQTIREAYRSIGDITMLEFDGVFRDAETLIKEMLPRTRADMLEYIQTYAPLRGVSGSLSPADNIWWGYTLRTGLSEGWMNLNPNTFGVRYNRTVAALLDSSDNEGQIAALRNQADEINEVPIDLAETAEIARQENPDIPPIDTGETQKLADAEMQLGGEVDVAAKVTADEARRAEEMAVSAEQEELARIGRNTEPLADASDEDLVRQILGINLDEIPTPLVERVGNRFGVFDENGEALQQFTTKKAANLFVGQEQARRREALIARARTVANESKDQNLSFANAAEIAPSPSIVSDIGMTTSQINTLASLPRMQAFRDILPQVDQTGLRKNYPVQMNMQQMDEIVRAIDKVVAEGEVTGTAARVVKNVQGKLKEELTRLDPEARAQSWADRVGRQTDELLEKGEYCNWTNP